ncbi:MAG: SAM-dependent methyltransferase, partial [Anaerolineales bacterium]
MKSFTRRKLLGAGTAGVLFQPACASGAPEPKPQPKPSKAEEFAGRVLEDIGAGLRGSLSYIGDRLGIFRAMAGAGPLTVEELARKTSLHSRYLREWLGAMVAAQYVEYRPDAKTYFLPPEHAAVLADEESAQFLGGLLEFLGAAAVVAPKVAAAFRTGKGVAYSEYPPDIFEGIARSSAPGFKHQLAQKWIPAMPQVEARLREGGSALDVGCGHGLASLTLAKTFPKA